VNTTAVNNGLTIMLRCAADAGKGGGAYS